MRLLNRAKLFLALRLRLDRDGAGRLVHVDGQCRIEVGLHLKQILLVVAISRACELGVHHGLVRVILA